MISGVKPVKIYYFDASEQIRQFDDLSILKGKEPIREIEADCKRGEYKTLQFALLPDKDGEMPVRIVPPDNSAAEKARTFCVNTDIVDKFGNRRTENLHLKAKNLMPVFVSVDTTGLEGDYRFGVDFQGNTIRVTLHVSNIEATAHNCGDLSSLARLRWLNSRAFEDDRPTKAYQAVGIDGTTLDFHGRIVTLGPFGFPAKICSYYTQSLYLSDRVRANWLLGEAQWLTDGELWYVSRALEIQSTRSGARWKAAAESRRLTMDVKAHASYEGMMEYRVEIRAKQDYEGVLGIRFPLGEDACKYNNGLGKKGGAFEDVDFVWNDLHQDCVWIGDVNCGARVKFLANDYVRPLVNIYYDYQPLKRPSDSWDYDGSGRITVRRTRRGGELCASAQRVRLQKGARMTFAFQMHVTPFGAFDPDKAYGVCYYHSNRLPDDLVKVVATAKKHGLNYIVVHHGNATHPFINYPFIETDRMKELVRLAHAEGIGVKFYYTVREHSNHMAEIFAYKALGDEILLRKRSEGCAYGWKEGKSDWLKTYFGDDIVQAWRVLYKKGKYKGDHDIAMLCRPDSRLDNYYIEGLDYLIKEIGIDGIYIDDTALDRTTLERARKALDQNGGLIDMHMWNHQERRAGDASCMNLYTELFPFIDNLWVGEGFDCRKLSEDYILTEVSGLPYGKPSQMLQGGGDPYCGMLYAMNNRYGWGVFDADRIYRLWDEFKIADARFYGYWDSENPVACDCQEVKASCYVKDGEILVCFYNFSQRKIEVSVSCALAHHSSACRAAVKGLQRKGTVDLSRPISLKARSGLMVIVKR